MIEVRILKIDERINDTSNISKLPTDFNGQMKIMMENLYYEP